MRGALALLGLARLLDEGDRPGGMALCEQGLEQLRQAGHLRRYAHDLASYSAYLAVVDEPDRGASASTEAMALARQLGDRRTLSIALSAGGYLAIASDHERAREHFREVVAIGDTWCAASARWRLAWRDDMSGRDGEAQQGYREALEQWRDTGDRRGMVYAIEGIAITLARAARFAAAAQLFAGAGTLASDVGSSSMARWNAWRDRHLSMLRDALSPEELSAHWGTGRRLDLDVLVKEALGHTLPREPSIR